MTHRRWHLLLLGLAASCTHANVESAREAKVPSISELEDVPATLVSEVDLALLSGHWFVLESNFDFWSKKDRSDVEFDYQQIPHPNVGKLDDVVWFRQGGKMRHFDGVDVQDPDTPGHIQWRGDGLLWGVINQWFIVLIDPDYEWAVIYFSKSNFGTGAGLEIIVRDLQLGADELAQIKSLIEADPDLRARASGLYRVPHGD